MKSNNFFIQWRVIQIALFIFPVSVIQFGLNKNRALERKRENYFESNVSFKVLQKLDWI